MTTLAKVEGDIEGNVSGKEAREGGQENAEEGGEGVVAVEGWVVGLDGKALEGEVKEEATRVGDGVGGFGEVHVGGF